MNRADLKRSGEHVSYYTTDAVFLLRAMLYQGNHDSNHKYWNIVSIERYTPDAGAAGKPRYQSTLFMLNK